MVRQGSAKALCVGSIPTLASKSNCFSSNGMGGIGQAIVLKTVPKVKNE